jgi:hypothetical protein
MTAFIDANTSLNVPPFPKKVLATNISGFLKLAQILYKSFVSNTGTSGYNIVQIRVATPEATILQLLGTCP